MANLESIFALPFLSLSPSYVEEAGMRRRRRRKASLTQEPTYFELQISCLYHRGQKEKRKEDRKRTGVHERLGWEFFAFLRPFFKFCLVRGGGGGRNVSFEKKIICICCVKCDLQLVKVAGLFPFLHLSSFSHHTPPPLSSPHKTGVSRQMGPIKHAK